MKSVLVLVLSVSFSLALAKETNFEKFAISNKQFTGAVYNELLFDNKENLVVSPFSVETILALTQSGAVGTTGEEIRSSLYLPKTQQETEDLIKTILPTLKSDKYIFKAANKIYVEDNFAIKDSFKNVALDVYQAAFDNIEFEENLKAADTINAWVEKQTNNKIHDLITSDELDEFTRVVLVNALYFNANWTTPFEPYLTKKANFYSPNDKVVEANLMFIESAELNFYASEELDAKFLELPFMGQNATMTFVLPNKQEGIAVLEKQAQQVLNSPKYQKEFVQVYLPKFRIEATIEFTDILKKLGIQAAFNPNVADFSGIAGNPGDILISKVTQKTFIDVNEIGVEAAAATAIVGPNSIPPTATQVFVADHPFMFYIKLNDIILFEGRVLEPKY